MATDRNPIEALKGLLLYQYRAWRTRMVRIVYTVRAEAGRSGPLYVAMSVCPVCGACVHTYTLGPDQRVSLRTLGTGSEFIQSCWMLVIPPQKNVNSSPRIAQT